LEEDQTLRRRKNPWKKMKLFEKDETLVEDETFRRT
jgi:hypothetical protein